MLEFWYHRTWPIKGLFKGLLPPPFPLQGLIPVLLSVNSRWRKTIVTLFPKETYSYKLNQHNTHLLFNIYLTVCLFFVQSMASKSYESGFKKYYGNRLDTISNETTEGEIKRIYDDWAGEYDEVILIGIHGTTLGDQCKGLIVWTMRYFKARVDFKSGRARGSSALEINFRPKISHPSDQQHMVLRGLHGIYQHNTGNTSKTAY